MEQILKDTIVEHLDRNKLIRRSQHGFFLGNMDKITEALDKGESVDVIFLDFAKAFDKVPIRRLLEKVRAHGR